MKQVTFVLDNKEDTNLLVSIAKKMALKGM